MPRKNQDGRGYHSFSGDENERFGRDPVIAKQTNEGVVDSNILGILDNSLLNGSSTMGNTPLQSIAVNSVILPRGFWGDPSDCEVIALMV